MIFYVDYSDTGHHVEFLCHLIKAFSAVNFIGSENLWNRACARAKVSVVPGCQLLSLEGPSGGFEKCKEFAEKNQNWSFILLHWDEYRIKIYRMIAVNPELGRRFGGVIFRSDLVRGALSKVALIDALVLRYYAGLNERTFLLSLDPEFSRSYSTIGYLKDPFSVDGQLPSESLIRWDIILLGKQTKRKNCVWVLETLRQMKFTGRVGVLGVLEESSRGVIHGYKSSLDLDIVDRHLSDDEFLREIAAAHVCCVPYMNWCGSSGIVVNSALIGTHLLAVDYGLIGEEVAAYGLGAVYSANDRNDFGRKLCSLLQMKENIASRRREYLRGRKPADFANELGKVFKSEKERETVV